MDVMPVIDDYIPIVTEFVERPAVTAPVVPPARGQEQPNVTEEQPIQEGHFEIFYRVEGLYNILDATGRIMVRRAATQDIREYIQTNGISPLYNRAAIVGRNDDNARTLSILQVGYRENDLRLREIADEALSKGPPPVKIGSIDYNAATLINAVEINAFDEIWEFIVIRHVNVNQIVEGQTALAVAVNSFNQTRYNSSQQRTLLDIIKLLLSKGAVPTQDALEILFEYDPRGAIQYLRSEDLPLALAIAVVNFNQATGDYDRQRKLLDIIELLLTQGVVPTQDALEIVLRYDPRGAIHYLRILNSNYHEILVKLLQTPNTNGTGDPLLHIAARHAPLTTLQELVNYCGNGIDKEVLELAHTLMRARIQGCHNDEQPVGCCPVM